MAPTQASQNILSAICTVINRCQTQVSLDACNSGVQATNGISSQLGLPSNGYNPYFALESAESSNQVEANSVATTACVNTINNLQCDSPTVVAAYNAANVNPFSGVPGMIPTPACNQVFTPAPSGTNLEVPIEMSGQGMASSTTAVTFSRTRTSLNTADYDGIVTYSFEIMANNNDTVSRNVHLVDANGTTVATISVPAKTSGAATRYRTIFAATSGASDYRIQLDGTSAASQLEVWVGRMLVQQVGATQTKIFVPLMVGLASTALTGDASLSNSQYGYVDDTYSFTYSQADVGWYVLWQKNNAAFSQLVANNPWTFEAVMNSDASNTSAYASIFDATTGSQVTASEVTTTSQTPVLVSSSFADSASNFNDRDIMEVQIKRGGTGPGLARIYRAGIWIKLNNLAHAEVYYRYLYSLTWLTGYGSGDETTYMVMLDKTLFSAPVSTYNELTGYVSGAGVSCTESVFDNGESDTAAIGAPVSGSGLTLSSTTLTRQRSAAFNITSADRFGFYVSAPTGSGACYPVNSFLVVGF